MTTPDGDFDNFKFPVLTREIGTTPSRGGLTTTQVPGTMPLNQLVEGTLRNVLGWSPRRDPQAFLAALRQSFNCREIEGRAGCLWTPRSGAVSVQAELGEITGAQASLFARARNTVDQVLPLLDGLRSLRADSDVEDVQSMRSIIRTELVELVAELGIVGGPRLPRVDQIFALLLGTGPDLGDPESTGGQLGLLRDRFGLTRSRINTVEEEKVFSDFLTMVDYVRSLEQSWREVRASFERGSTSGAFLGTQLVLLAQVLAVISDSVAEVNFTLDSVFLGAAERATLVITFDGIEAPVTLAELLDWIDAFVSREAVRLLQDSGKDGVVAFRSTLKRLEKLVRLLLDNLPDRLDVARVERALEELDSHLVEAGVLADAIEGVDPETPPPNPIVPGEATLGLSTVITIQGLDTATLDTQGLSFGDAIDIVIPPANVPPDPPSPLRKAVKLTIFVEPQAGRGPRPVILGGRVIGELKVKQQQASQTMTLTGVSASATPDPNAWNVTIAGGGFIAPASFSFGEGVADATVGKVTVKSGAELTALVRFHQDPGLFSTTAPQKIRIRVANPDGQWLVWMQGVSGLPDPPPLPIVAAEIQPTDRPDKQSRRKKG